MKAEVFIDLVTQAIIFDNNTPYDKVNEVFADKICKVHKLYSTPFTAKLITELFEGWEKSPPSEIDYNCKRNAYQFTIIDFSRTDGNTFLYRSENPVKSWKEQFPAPRTVADFVSDCERMRIYLQWREQTIKEYFS